MEKENIGLQVFYVILRIEAYTSSVIKTVLDWKFSEYKLLSPVSGICLLFIGFNSKG